MKTKILSYSSITIISLLLLVLTGTTVHAQQSHPNPTPKRNQVKKKEEPKEIVPLYNGTSVAVDIFGAGSYLLGGDFWSTEVSVSSTLKNKFIPTLELGYGKTDTWGETGIRYKAGAPYFRIGMDYNTMSKKKEKNSYLYVGARYGFTTFTYDVMDAPLIDPIWGTAIDPSLRDDVWGGSLFFDHTGMKASMHWMELLVGVRAQIFKDLSMGWSIRYKFKLAESASEYGNPWYVPGYGKYGSSTIGLTYNIIYKLPF